MTDTTIGKIVLAADPDLAQVDGLALWNATMLYLFRGYTYRTYGARLTKLLGRRPNIRAVTEALGRCGELCKNYKLWSFYVVKHELDQRAAARLGAEWSITKADVLAFRLIDRTVLAHMRKLARRYRALTVANMDANVVRIQSEIRTWLLKFVQRKLRFIASSQNMLISELAGDLVCNGIQGLYNMYPFVESKLHALNIVKRVAHNCAMNMINHYTSEKAGRLLRDSKGVFSARVLSLDDAGLEHMQHEGPDVDLQADVHRLFSEARGSKLRFLELLAGSYSPEFTAWLCARGHQVDTNETLCDRVRSDRYIRLCLDFLGVQFERGIRFVQTLRSRFAAYAEGRSLQGVAA